MYSSIKAVGSFFFAILLSACLVSPMALAQGATRGTVKVMTYNINEGSDFVQVLSATDPLTFVAGVQATLNEVTASNPSLRMKAVAHQIGMAEPDLVGLQEVTTWLKGPLDAPSVLYDMLSALMDELAKQGLHYRVVVQVPEFQLAGPLDPSMSEWLFALDSDVMLARSDKGDLQISNIHLGNYQTLLPVTIPGPSGGQTIYITRGWGAADVTLHRQTFRFIVTHIENFIPQAREATLYVQGAQVKELTDGPAYADMPVIIAGDFNADAIGKDDSILTYNKMASLGFPDAWGTLHPKVPGATWPLVDSSPVNTAFQRIDYIFFSDGRARPLTSKLAGNDPQDKIGELWPSDHAGVRAELQFGH